MEKGSHLERHFRRRRRSVATAIVWATSDSWDILSEERPGSQEERLASLEELAKDLLVDPEPDQLHFCH